MKKNILIIGNYPPPYGGVPHHIERLSEYLAGNGWNCHVLSGGTTGKQILENGVSIYKPTYGRKVRGAIAQMFNRQFRDWLMDGTLDRDEPGHWRRYLMYADVGEEIIRDNNIRLIASYNLLSYGPIGTYLAKKFSIPNIISIFGEVYKYQAMAHNAAFFKEVAGGAFRLLSCSDHCGRSVKKAGIENEVRTVTYGVNVEHFSPGTDPVALRARYGIGDDRVVLFVGRLGREMGVDTFLAAAHLLAPKYPHVRFVVVGQAEDLTDDVVRICNASKGRCVAVVNAPYSDLPDYYRLATLVVVPTRGDRTCSSLSAMEAMATRKPVVGFAIGGIPEIIDHERTGLLVEAENLHALAASISRLLDDARLCDQLAGAGFAQSQARFDERLVNIAMERHFLDALGAQ